MAPHKCPFENDFFVESNKDKVIKVKKKIKKWGKTFNLFILKY